MRYPPIQFKLILTPATALFLRQWRANVVIGVLCYVRDLGHVGSAKQIDLLWGRIFNGFKSFSTFFLFYMHLVMYMQCIVSKYLANAV